MPRSLLPHVEDQRLSALQARLESMASLSLNFLVLISGSTIIATLGLFQNSPAVIIGAMIVAPLMRPLAGLSLATLTADLRLLSRALATLVVGTITGAAIAALLASIFRSLELTPEIMARTHPNLLDLGVALSAGAIGAYCQAKEKLTDTLAGVAIAVALVPPLAVVGIGLAFHLTPIWTGAALLYATNLIGISVAGSVVFMLLGFSPLTRARRGLIISAAMVVVLVVPLAFSMRELVMENQISTTIKRILKEKTFTFRDVQLHSVDVKRFESPMIVTATVLAANQPITPHQVKLVQEFLSGEIKAPIEFRLRIIPASVITAAEPLSDLPQTVISPTGNQTAPETMVNPEPESGPAKTKAAPDTSETSPAGSTNPDRGENQVTSKPPGNSGANTNAEPPAANTPSSTTGTKENTNPDFKVPAGKEPGK